MNKELLIKMLNEGYVMVQKHPNTDLSIYNYTRKCQYEANWNEVTLLTRGLILDGNMNIIARPFGKFKNWEEYKPEEIPNLPFEVFDKMDGSFGILFHFNNEWIIASRGSFMSDQAIKATEMLKNYDISNLNKEYTYLFEIIY